jgi:hypothetical protein
VEEKQMIERNLFMSAASYESLEGKGEFLWYLVDSIVASIGALTNDKIEAQLQIETSEGKVLTTLALRKKVQKFKELILNNDLNILAFTAIDTTKPLEMVSYTELADIYIYTPLSGGASFYQIGFREWYALDFGVDRFQNLLVNLLFDVCRNIDVVAGFVTHDIYWPGLIVTAHERHIGFPGLVKTADYKDHFRGYFWGNLLSENHVHALGGIENIVRNAPCYQVKEVGNRNVYLQLTESILDFSDEKLARLKDYFKPILRTKQKETDPRGYDYLRYIPD